MSKTIYEIPIDFVGRGGVSTMMNTRNGNSLHTFGPSANSGLVLEGDTLTTGATRRNRSRSVRRGNNERIWSIQNPLTVVVPNGQNRVYAFSQRFVGTSITSSTVAITPASYAFQVSSLSNSSTLSSLFDQYRIKMIEFITYPRVGAAFTTSGNPGRLTSVIDYDDTSNLATEAAAMEYQSALTSSGLDGHYRRFVPHVAYATYSGAFTSYGNATSPWIDAASPNVDHYGVKLLWTITDTAYVQDVVIVLHTEWRSTR